MIDIAERKRVEEVLRQSEDRFRRLVELMPVASMCATPRGSFSTTTIAPWNYGDASQNRGIRRSAIAALCAFIFQTVRLCPMRNRKWRRCSGPESRLATWK